MTNTLGYYPVDLLLPDRWWGLVRYRLQHAMTIHGVYIPAHFITDGATVPRLFWILFPPVCKYFPAAIVHDYLLQQGVSWRKANQIFRQILKELDIKWWRRKSMGAAVGMYGFYRETIYGH